MSSSLWNYINHQEMAIICHLRLTICSVDWHLSSALCQHCGPLDTCSQHHGLSLGHHFLLFLAKNAGEHLPLSWSGTSVGPDCYTHFHLLHSTTGGKWTQSIISESHLHCTHTCVFSCFAPPHLSAAVILSPCVPLSGMLS